MEVGGEDLRTGREDLKAPETSNEFPCLGWEQFVSYSLNAVWDQERETRNMDEQSKMDEQITWVIMRLVTAISEISSYVAMCSLTWTCGAH